MGARMLGATQAHTESMYTYIYICRNRRRDLLCTVIFSISAAGARPAAAVTNNKAIKQNTHNYKQQQANKTCYRQPSG